MIRVVLPAHLRNLAGVGKEVEVDVADGTEPFYVIGAMAGG